MAMATHDDIKANAEHIHMADQFVEVPSGPSANNYGNVKTHHKDGGAGCGRCSLARLVRSAVCLCNAHAARSACMHPSHTRGRNAHTNCFRALRIAVAAPTYVHARERLRRVFQLCFEYPSVSPFRGHASEKPELPRELAAKGIIFLGPHEDAMAALGDKVGSTILAQSAGVPTLPWSGSDVVLAPQASGQATVAVPERVYHSACVASVDQALASCRRIGYPAMLKVRFCTPCERHQVHPCFFLLLRRRYWSNMAAAVRYQSGEPSRLMHTCWQTIASMRESQT